MEDADPNDKLEAAMQMSQNLMATVEAKPLPDRSVEPAEEPPRDIESLNARQAAIMAKGRPAVNKHQREDDFIELILTIEGDTLSTDLFSLLFDIVRPSLPLLSLGCVEML